MLTGQPVIAETINWFSIKHVSYDLVIDAQYRCLFEQ